MILILLYSEIVIILQMVKILFLTAQAQHLDTLDRDRRLPRAADGTISPGYPEQEQAPVTNGTSDHTTVDRLLNQSPLHPLRLDSTHSEKDIRRND